MSYNAFYVNKWPLANCLKPQQQQPCLQGRGTQSDPKMGGGLVRYEMNCRQILLSLCVYACHHTNEWMNGGPWMNGWMITTFAVHNSTVMMIRNTIWTCNKGIGCTTLYFNRVGAGRKYFSSSKACLYVEAMDILWSKIKNTNYSVYSDVAVLYIGVIKYHNLFPFPLPVPRNSHNVYYNFNGFNGKCTGILFDSMEYAYTMWTLRLF